MKNFNKHLLPLILLLCAASNAFSQSSVLETAAKGDLQAFVKRILNADNATVVGWARNQGKDIDFANFNPQQAENLKGFIINVAVFKSSLDSSYSLFVSETRGAEYYAQHQGNMIFDASDDFFRTIIINPEVKTMPTFITTVGASARARTSILNSGNYQGYARAMLAKADAVNNIHRVMCIDKNYTYAELKAVLQYGIRAAEYVYEGTPLDFSDSETVILRNTIIAELKAKRYDDSCRQTGSPAEESRIRTEREEEKNRELLERIASLEYNLAKLRVFLVNLKKGYKQAVKNIGTQLLKADDYDRLARTTEPTNNLPGRSNIPAESSVINRQKSRDARTNSDSNIRQSDWLKNKIKEIAQEIAALEQELVRLRAESK